ncbi:MAG: serine/threonine protein kinase/Tfp pilus assembly protein PilF [Rhodothermales bacterium]|jgi:serine/threonine protein kinase/Tfp pilus assembly protein PilF
MKDVPTGQWKRIDAIMDGALDLDPALRGEYVRKECGDDQALLKQVQDMLGAGDIAGTFLENKGPEMLGEMRDAVRKAVDAKDNELPETHVGPYRLIRPIGHGGMGQVYLAMRDDASYTRYVAVKVIRRGMDTDEILKRFKMERRILASLAHPNIARLLDGGATEDGLSYFVMEYIEGQPIGEYCNAQKLPVRQRLELFRKVCDAVQFAHRNLIVHRDLKPSNILVTSDGTPKLLDFGIAKVLNPNLAGYTMPMTNVDVRVMTPEYASPEQMRGDAVTTASDVYQLGILLYELLTGGRPHKTKGRSRKEIEDLVLSAEPEKPSTAISGITGEEASKRTRRDGAGGSAVERLRKMLSGDLDRIVLMALRKEADRRYASADFFQEDIRRYLEGMPVSAQADTVSYRARKFVLRHKVGVVASSALVILLIAVTVLAVRFALVTSEQSERIVLAAAKTEQVSRFLVSTFQWANPEYSLGEIVTVPQLMDRAVVQIDQELAGQPEVQAHMLMELGIAYREMGDFDASERLLTRALAMRRADAAVPRLDLAASIFQLGVLRDWTGEWEKAEALLDESLTLREQEVGRNDPLISSNLNSLASIYAYSGRRDEAQEMFQDALEIERATAGDGTLTYAEILANQGWALHDIGLELETEGEREAMLDRAEEAYRTSLELQVALLGDGHPNVASMHNNLGSLLQDRGRYAAAEQMHRETLAMRRVIYGEEHSRVGNSISQVARAVYAQGNMEEAERLFRQALNHHLSSLPAGHPFIGRDRALLGTLLVDKGDYAEAEQLLSEALAIYQANLDEGHPWITQADGIMQALLLEIGRGDYVSAPSD